MSCMYLWSLGSNCIERRNLGCQSAVCISGSHFMLLTETSSLKSQIVAFYNVTVDIPRAEFIRN